MKDIELQLQILRAMYNKRQAKREFRARDFEGLVSAAEFGRICIQLRDKGLVVWNAPAGEKMLAIGSAELTTNGIAFVEEPPQTSEADVVEKRVEKVRVTCPSCQGVREALVLAEDQKKEAYYDAPDDPPSYYYERSRMLKCAGCQFVFLERASWNDDNADEWGHPVTLSYFPKWAEEPLPNWIIPKSLPRPSALLIFQQLRQVLLAFESQYYWLACVGCRSVLETAMIEKVGDQRSFKANIEEYHRAGHISKVDRDQLEIVLEAGHGATHRSFEPTRSQAKVVIDIACRILEGVYVHAPQAQKLKSKIPPRSKT